MFKNKNVIVTGGAGFIGSNVAIELVRQGAKVTIIDSMLPQYGGNLFNIAEIKDDITFYQCDVGDKTILEKVLAGVDYIFNLAGQLSHQDSMADPLLDMKLNVESHIHLLELCRRLCPEAVIVYTSTRQLYGKPQYLPVDEKHPVLPSDVNGINKYSCEQYHRLYHEVYGLKTVVLRLTNTYGPRQLIKNARQAFTGWFMNRAITNQDLQIYGDGEQLRDFNYVDDVVAAMLIAALSPKCYGKVYNLSGEIASVKKVGQIIAALNEKIHLVIVPYPEERKKIEIGDYYGTSGSFEADTGWNAKVSLEIGLKKFYEYYLEHQSHYIDS